ncbi:MAG: sensor histidine kinase [Lachnospiraceae bacterium]|nr:sensor histidine kinase [Lachnospiraceae bacterium]
MREKWKRRFRNTKLAGKMLVVYVLIMGMTCGISFLALQAGFSVYDKQLYEKSLQELEFFAGKVNDQLTEIENLSYSLALDSEVQEILAQMADTKYLSNEYYYELSKIRKIFFDEINIQKATKNAMYLDRKNIRITIGTDCGKIEEAMYKNLLQQCEAARGAYVVIPPTKDFPYQLSGRDILETKYASLRYLGTVILTCDIGSIIKQEKKSLKYANSTLFVFHNGNVIYGEEELQLDDESQFKPKLEGNQGYKVEKRGGKLYFMSYLKDEKSDWMYINYIPYDEIFGRVKMVRSLMLGAMSAIFVLALFLLNRVAKAITSPLNQLTETMYLVQKGDFKSAREMLVLEEWTDEAGLLARDFKVMLEEIENLIHENYEKQLLLQDTKYRMLQAQINPHFLYNTLNALNWMVKAGKNKEAGKMIIELGSLMRASFSKEPDATVAEEIATVKSYITIQQFRYKDRVEFFVETGENLESYRVPRMILQPLVENAIYYGVEESLTCCRIWIEAKVDENNILLRVKDEGIGISEEDLEAVRNGTIQPKGNGIGLKNIRERILMAHADSEFMIESTLGEGTQITIKIPIEKRENVDVSVVNRG